MSPFARGRDGEKENQDGEADEKAFQVTQE
jgi:hypothetical protein